MPKGAKPGGGGVSVGKGTKRQAAKPSKAASKPKAAKSRATRKRRT